MGLVPNPQKTDCALRLSCSPSRGRGCLSGAGRVGEAQAEHRGVSRPDRTWVLLFCT